MLKMTMPRKSAILCVLGAILVWSGVCLAATDPSLIGWWRLDESGGTTAADSSGHGNNATLNGSAVFTSGLYGRGVYCNGSEAYVALPDVLTANATLAFWFKPDWDGTNTSDYRLFDAGAGDKYFFISKGSTNTAMPADYFGFFFEDATDLDFQNVRIAAAGNIVADTWYHVAVTWQYSGGPGILYLNGVEISRATGLGAFPTLSTSPRFGYATGGGGVTATNGAASVFDDIKIFDRVLTAAEIPGLMEGAALELASAPSPANEATDVLRDTNLEWKSGIYAAAHDIYFGTVFTDVNNASRTSAGALLISQGQSANSYDPPSRLDFGTTYYWRVDEVNAPPSNTIFKGTTWSFTTEPFGYPVTNITATASGSSDAFSLPANTINGSGLTGDLHGTDLKTMWRSNSTQPIWIQYDFDRLYKISEMWVWNHNTTFEALLGFGVKDATVEYSVDGTTFTKLGDFEFAQAPGADNYAHNTTVPFDGVAARSVRITVNSSWGGGNTAGLSEVRFLYIPVSAREPQPATDATDVSPTTSLSWRSGREAASHEVYLGTDPNALTLAGTSATNSFTPANLSLETEYYWRVDEVNTAATPSTWTGPVWNFTTPVYLVVDDMESYDDQEETSIFNVWIDGYGTTTNGSQVGYSSAANNTFGETTIVHGGSQSMPFMYDNTSATNSEATRTFDPAQDWTVGGAKTLVIYFRGDPTNTTGQLFVKINDTKVNYSGNVAAETSTVWKQWNVDLTTAGGQTAVRTLTLGVSGSGKGTLYIDDIRLYKTAPAVVVPVDPGTAGLVSSFDMEGGKVADSVSGITGTLNDVTFVASLAGFGQAAQFNGTTTYVDLGANYWTSVISKLSSCTFALWVNYTGEGAVWQRVFDFGSGSNTNVFLTTSAGTAGLARFVVKTNVPTAGSTAAGYVETTVSVTRALTVGWHHIAGVVDATGDPVMYLYVDGNLVAGPSPSRLPKDMVLQADTPWQMWLGRSQYTADPYFSGSLDNLKVYNRALTAGEIGYLAGDR